MHASVTREAVSHYRILNKLGAGGMGEVYLADDTVLNRRVAIKFLPQDIGSSKQAKAALIREAQAAARLDHPNICTIHEVSEEDGCTFIVMEYVEGETLAHRIKKKQVNVSECLEIAVQVADALAEAHAHAIIHRDINPQNIMLTANDQAKVIDFGVARVIRDRSRVDSEAVTESLFTKAGIIFGTVTYMSPEQVRGETLDARSDIFSFGAVLYEMLTCHKAFWAGSKAKTISAILSREPAPLTRYSGHVPAELQRIVKKALRKNRKQRYQTIGDLLIDLRRLKHQLEFEEELIRSFPPGATEDILVPDTKPANSGGPSARAVTHHKSPEVLPAVKKDYVKGRGRGLISILASILLLGLVAFSFHSYIFPNGKVIHSMAILPFINVNNDPETEILSNGIAESLINSFSRIDQLRIVPPTTAALYRGEQIDARQVGRELGVEAILTAKLVQRGDSITTQLELVDTSDGSQLWRKQYDLKASNLLAVKQQIAREVSERLNLALDVEAEKRLNEGDAGNNEAYQFYLRGRHFWNKRSGENLEKAIREFEQAIEKDPDYALAYTGLADSYVLMEEYASTPSSETLPKARAAVKRALQIDDFIAEAHASLGMIEQNSWNFVEAEREFRRAIALNPNYPTVHNWYGFYLRLVRGRFEEAMAEIRRAQQLDPLSPSIGVNLSLVYIDVGNFEAATKEAEKVIEIDPDFAGSHRALGIVYRKQGRYVDAITEFEKAVELSKRRSVQLAHLGVSYAMTGNKTRTRELLNELEQKYDRCEALGQNLAGIYAALGDKETAFAWLEKDFQARSGFLLFIAHDPGEDILRNTLSNDPRWNDLLQRIGLPLN